MLTEKLEQSRHLIRYFFNIRVSGVLFVIELRNYILRKMWQNGILAAKKSEKRNGKMTVTTFYAIKKKLRIIVKFRFFEKAIKNRKNVSIFLTLFNRFKSWEI